MIRPALGAGAPEGAEGRFLTAGALDHGSLWAPSVDLAHLYVLNFVVRLDALDYLCHMLLSPLFPFPQEEVVVGSRAREYKA